MGPLALVPIGLKVGSMLFGKKKQQPQPQQAPPSLGFPGPTIGQLAQQQQIPPIGPQGRPMLPDMVQNQMADPFAMTPNVQQTEMQDPRLLPAPQSVPMPKGPELKRRGLLRGLRALDPADVMRAQQGGIGGLLGLLAGSALQKTPGGR